MPILPALLPDALAVLDEVVAEPVEFELALVVEFAAVAAATAAELVDEEAKLEDEAELDVPELEAEEEAAAADEEAAAEEEELGEAVVEAGAAAEEEEAAAVAAAPVPLD